MVTAGSVYMVTNRENGKRYIGMTVKKPRQRFHEHASLAKNPNSGYTLAKAIRKYGKAAFDVTTLATAESREALAELERWYIATYKPEYNSTDGGEGEYHHTPEVVAKIRLFNQLTRNKPVVCVSTGVVYPSCTVAAKAFGLPRGEAVAKVCRGVRLSAAGIKFAWHEDAYEGDPGEIPAEHSPLELRRYSADARDYSKYKTPEFSEKLRSVMLARKQRPTEDAMAKAWAANRNKIYSSCGKTFASQREAAVFLGCHPSTIGNILKRGGSVGAGGISLTREVNNVPSNV
jgi:group I intron endonuclease